MSISDDLMWRYFELLSFRPLADIAALRKAIAEGRNPRDVKFELGVEIVDRFHGAGAGARARDAFVARFQQGHVPEKIESIDSNYRRRRRSAWPTCSRMPAWSAAPRTATG